MLSAEEVASRLAHAARAPVQRHDLAPLLDGAWSRRHNLRLVDALYVELAARIEAPLVTTDGGLAAVVPLAELVIADPLDD